MNKENVIAQIKSMTDEIGLLIDAIEQVDESIPRKGDIVFEKNAYWHVVDILDDGTPVGVNMDEIACEDLPNPCRVVTEQYAELERLRDQRNALIRNFPDEANEYVRREKEKMIAGTMIRMDCGEVICIPAEYTEIGPCRIRVYREARPREDREMLLTTMHGQAIMDLKHCALIISRIWKYEIYFIERSAS